jgi:hypothetical protein
MPVRLCQITLKTTPNNSENHRLGPAALLDPVGESLIITTQ